MLVGVSLQPAVACEQAGSSVVGVVLDQDDGPPALEPGLEMPELFSAPLAWHIAESVSPVPSAPASLVPPPPFLGAPLRPPCA